MKFSAMLLAAAAAANDSYETSPLENSLGYTLVNDLTPHCAQPCVEDALKSTTDCKVEDFKCFCKNHESILNQATPCIRSKCGDDDYVGPLGKGYKFACDAWTKPAPPQ